MLHNTHAHTHTRAHAHTHTRAHAHTTGQNILQQEIFARIKFLLSEKSVKLNPQKI